MLSSKNIRLKRKNKEIKISKRPVKSILRSDLVEILKYEKDETIIKLKKDCYIIGQNSPGGYYSLGHILAVDGKRKPSLTVTPWLELSMKLKLADIEPVKVNSSVFPIHYDDELCIPCNTYKRDGFFYIVNKNDVGIFVDEPLSKEEQKFNRELYYNKPAKNIVLDQYEDQCIKIGREIDKRLSLNENIDRLDFKIFNNEELKKISFDITDRLVDTYRFLTIFDGNEYVDSISKEFISQFSKIVIETFKDNIIIETFDIFRKDINI